MIELTQTEIARLGQMLFVGRPGPRFLWEWIQPVSEADLDLLMSPDPDRLIAQTPDWRNPREVRNWVSRRTRYVSDSELWGRLEHWPDPAMVIQNARDDCDGLGILAASILFSMGVPGVRLTIGHAWGGGHLWVEFHDPETGAAYLIETTGNDEVQALPRVIDCIDYVPRMQAERIGPREGRIWICGSLYDVWKAARLV